MQEINEFGTPNLILRTQLVSQCISPSQITSQAKTLIILQCQYLHHLNQLQVGQLPCLLLGGHMATSPQPFVRFKFLHRFCWAGSRRQVHGSKIVATPWVTEMHLAVVNSSETPSEIRNPTLLHSLKSISNIAYKIGIGKSFNDLFLFGMVRSGRFELFLWGNVIISSSLWLCYFVRKRWSSSWENLQFQTGVSLMKERIQKKQLHRGKKSGQLPKWGSFMKMHFYWENHSPWKFDDSYSKTALRWHCLQ